MTGTDDEAAGAPDAGNGTPAAPEEEPGPEPAPEPAPVGWLPRTTGELFGEGASAEHAYELLTVDVPSESWIPALETCRDTLGCTYFDWLSAVDEPGTGFLVCAHVVALPGGGDSTVRRLILRTTVPHDAPVLPTATAVYGGAGWHERETHEMFGVVFTGHDNLEPLLLPDNFEGHPLRKDFVLAARVAKAWPGAKEPGESGHGGPKRRQMLPPGVPDPNEWGPQKGQLPPVPSRPARGRAAAGERPARRTRTASSGPANAEQPAGTPAKPEDSAKPGTSAKPETPAKPQNPEKPGTSTESGTSAATAGAAATPAAPEAPAGEQPATDTRSADAPWHNARPAFEKPTAAEPDAQPDAAQEKPAAAPTAEPAADTDSTTGTTGTEDRAGAGKQSDHAKRTGNEDRTGTGRPQQPDEETEGDA